LARRGAAPVIFLTAFNDSSTVGRAARTGPYGYITKPFGARELGAAIEVALYKSRIEKSLKESERWFSSTLRCVADGVVAVDNEHRVRFMNPAAEKALGVRQEQALGRPAAEVLAFDDSAVGPLRALPESNDANTGITFGRVVVAADGRRVPVDESVAAIRADDGSLLGAVCALRDVSSRVQAEQALRRSEERFRAAFDFAPVGMALIGMDGRFLQGNAALHTLLRCRPDELQRLRQKDVTLPEDADTDANRLRGLLASKVPFVQFERRFRALDGTVFWALVSASMLRSDDTAVCLLYQVHDLTEQRAAQDRLLHQAHHDELTGLSNRAHLREVLGSWIQSARRHGTRFALVYIDLDHFKQANDRFGHAVGDEVLRRVAKQLTGTLRTTDFVARLGGDEFVALIADVNEHHDVVIAVQKMAGHVTEPMLIEGQAVQVGLSAGACLYPTDAADVDALLRHADEALYRAKAAGRGLLRFYDQNAQLAIDREDSAARRFHAALGTGAVPSRWHGVSWFERDRAAYAELTPHWNGHGASQAYGLALLDFAHAHGLGGNLAELMELQWLEHRRTGPSVADAASRTGLLVDIRQWRDAAVADRIRALLAADAAQRAPATVVLVLSAQHLAAASPAALKLLSEIRSRGCKLALREFDPHAPTMEVLSRCRPEYLTLSARLMEGEYATSRQTQVIRALIVMARCFEATVLVDGPLSPAWRCWLPEQGCAGMFEPTPDVAQAARRLVQTPQ